MGKCLYCYKELGAGQTDFHPACAKKMFGTATAPLLPYTRAQIGELAEQVIRSQTTVPGVQEKLSLDVDQSDRNEPPRFTIVGLWGRYILKPQTDKYPHLPELEDVTMHMAEAAKIQVVPHSLIRFADGELCYITRRIDRDDKGGKYPMEDMCQLSERLTEYKYKGSYEQISRLVSRHATATKLDTVNFWEQVVFSFLVGNADMHLKNFSLYSPVKDQVRLAPAYDLLSTSLVMPQDTEDLALTLNGRKRKITRTDFISALQTSGLEEKIVTNLLAKFHRAAPRWYEWIDASFLPDDMAERYKATIAAQLQRLAD